MSQLFKPSANYFSRLSIVLGLTLVGLGLGFVFYFPGSPFVTQQGVVKEQPVQFSHAHHVNDIGIDCRYCHTSVEQSKVAGIPPTYTCMSCHSQLFTDSRILEPVRQSMKNGLPIEWVRVHDLPDFVYFDHSIHVNKGVGCASCHGPVHEMPLVYQSQPLTMKWCLECHRNPEAFLRPKEFVFDTAWKGPESMKEQLALGLELRKKYNVKSLEDCTTCHR